MRYLILDIANIALNDIFDGKKNGDIVIIDSNLFTTSYYIQELVNYKRIISLAEFREQRIDKIFE